MAALAAQGIAAEKAEVIRSVKFVGVRALGKGEIRSVMATKFPSFFAWLPFVPLPPFRQADLNDDIRKITALYRDEGFYSADVSEALKIDEKKDRREVRVTIRVNEGKPALIGRLEVVFTRPVTDIVRARALSFVSLRRGMVFKAVPYEASKQRLDLFLSNNGYGGAQVTPEAVVDKDRNTADILFTVDPGPLQKFGQVTVSGTVEVRDQDVLRQLAFREGELFSREKLTRSQLNIFRLDLFRSVTLTPQGLERASLVPVVIQLEERKKQNLTLGAGYGTEDLLRLQASWSKRYLWGEPRTLSVAVRHSALLFSGSVDLTQAYFIDKFSTLGIHAGYERDYFTSYSNEFIGSQVRVGRVLRPDLESYVAYNLEVNRPVSVAPGVAESLQATKPGSYYFISSLMAGIKYDDVRENADPRRGQVYSLFVEPSSFLLGSQVDYIRGIAEARLYAGMLKNSILATRFRFGFIEPLRFTTQIPIFKRFFAGGSNSIRGYAFQSLGPKDAEGNPIGGDYLVETNIEFRFPVYRNFNGALFIDAGNVYLDRVGIGFSTLEYAVGWGIRYATVIGPVRLDLAFPLQPFPEISLSRYRIYLNLGNAF